MDDSRKRLVEAIAYGPDVSPSDRLRALQLLEALDPSPRDSAIGGALDDLSDGQLDEELDSRWVVFVVEACLEDREVMGVNPERFPSTCAYLHHELERRVQEGIRALNGNG